MTTHLVVNASFFATCLFGCLVLACAEARRWHNSNRRGDDTRRIR